METSKYVAALQDVLEKRFLSSSFSLDGYQENAVCLQYVKEKWIVYCGERGNHYDEVQCDTILMACLNVIRKMTHKTEDISAMENELLGNLHCQKTA
jgi:hypothetical protein